MNRFFHFNNINKAHILWALLIIILNCKAQLPYNLVPNYSFEDHTLCGSVANAGAVSWYSPTVVPNYQYSYANACSTNPCCGVPSNVGGNGWQYARTGVACVAMEFSLNNGGSIRFYLQTQLIDTLKTNHCYYVEFYVNLINIAKDANNNISLYISDSGIGNNGIKNVYENPQILQYGNPIITDTLKWVRVGGIYTALGGESYITIGDFTDDAHTDTVNIKGGFYPGGYYIDDVSVIPLDSMQLKADAGRDTTIVKGDSVWVGSRLCGLQNVVWYDAGGNVIDTGAPGLWVKPTSNTFYVIEQDVCGQYSRDTVYISVVPLPVIIDNYKLIIDNVIQNTVENVWETASEVNVSHFNVQRSEDGIIFGTVGTVKAKGASKYFFVDNTNHTGVIYYRLEIVDNNGDLSYSEVKELSIIHYQLSIDIYPNPTKGEVNIQLPMNGNWQITATDIEGRVVWEHECSGCSGIIKHNLNTSKGLYFIKIINTTTGQQTVKKITLQ